MLQEDYFLHLALNVSIPKAIYPVNKNTKKGGPKIAFHIMLIWSEYIIEPD